LAEHLAHYSLLFFGSGAAKFQPLVSTNSRAAFLTEVQPSAISTGELALGAYQRQEFQDVAYYEPFYLKEVYTTTPKGK
jgi:tRNA threonylcarbamoyladenosine biosynthesis protein TsaB